MYVYTRACVRMHVYILLPQMFHNYMVEESLPNASDYLLNSKIKLIPSCVSGL